MIILILSITLPTDICNIIVNSDDLMIQEENSVVVLGEVNLINGYGGLSEIRSSEELKILIFS